MKNPGSFKLLSIIQQLDAANKSGNTQLRIDTLKELQLELQKGGGG